MQVQRGTGRVNALDVRDQQASAGHRHTLPEAGRDMLQMYPAEAQKRAQLGGRCTARASRRRMAPTG